MSEAKRYGRLEFIEEAGRDRSRNQLWKLRCECGKVVILRSYTVRSGRQKSCGCLRKQKLEDFKTRTFRGMLDEKGK